ncbi:MAG: enolase C-terminal domain-like protein [Polyangiaceae bacterium]
MSDTCIVRAEAENFDMDLRESFAISGGAQERAANVLVTVTLASGHVGLGECAPFPAFNGETQADVLAEFRKVLPLLDGADASDFRALARRLGEATHSGALRFGLDTAILDAVCRRFGTPMPLVFGGSTGGTLRSDITITAGDVAHARTSAREAARRGFDTLKVKVGAGSAHEDVARILAIHEEAPLAAFILDANGAYDVGTAKDVLDRLSHVPIALFEQPTPGGEDDVRALAEVRAHAAKRGTKVAADESVNGVGDLARLVGAVDVVNVKPSKSGLVGAADLAVAALGAGFGLMIGGMVESSLAMSASASLAVGIGRFTFVDLDTPLFFADAPLEGGMRYDGATIHVDRCIPGHGVRLRARTP